MIGSRDMAGKKSKLNNFFDKLKINSNATRQDKKKINNQLQNQLQAQYIRYPATPIWTYVSLGAAQQPQFSITPSYQDFELPLDYFQDLVNKILQFAGMEIRETEVVQYALGQEQIENQDEQ